MDGNKDLTMIICRLMSNLPITDNEAELVRAHIIAQKPKHELFYILAVIAVVVSFGVFIGSL